MNPTLYGFAQFLTVYGSTCLQGSFGLHVRMLATLPACTLAQSSDTHGYITLTLLHKLPLYMLLHSLQVCTVAYVFENITLMLLH